MSEKHDNEMAQLAHSVFEHHRETCTKGCAKYNGTPATAANLCFEGLQHYREMIDPQRFAGQRRGRL